MDILERVFRVIFEDDNIRSREELAEIFDTSDRAVRNLIRQARRQGIPIMALPNGGYKMASTDEEKQKLLHMYKGRAMDELVTYSALRKTLQLDGQITVEELLEAVR